MFKSRINKNPEITFDEQGGGSTSKILEGMEEFSRLAAGDFPGLNIATPKFMSDDNCSGLQAADAGLAFTTRRVQRLSSGRTLANRRRLDVGRGEALSMPYSVKIWTDQEFRQASETVLKKLRESIADAI